MRVYLVSYGENGEGSTVIAVKDSLIAAKKTALHHVSEYWSGKIPVRFAGTEFARPNGFTWALQYSGCDTVRIERWEVT